jgi:ABC-type nitrate/sulfonate/bicarbonate transport system ATPase subunit/ABC-type transporter Mla maintaining outer membrane lipid asymmetry permease subunit MlaE
VGGLAFVRNLAVGLPDGSTVVEAANVDLHASKVIALLGPSGSGKTTLIRAIFSPEELRDAGYSVTWDDRTVASEPAFVPQRGALLDHLDVSENVALAQAGGKLPIQPATWLRAVDLDEGMAAPGRSVAALSGGQAQRVAVARVLAAGRKLIVMDEPSVGLDPVGVRMLARILVKQAREHQAAIIIITHDLALAGGASDEILFLDPGRRSLVKLNWESPAEFDDADVRQRRLGELEGSVEELLLQERPIRRGRSVRRRFDVDLLAPVRVAGDAISRAFHPHLLAESAVVFRRTIRESLVRPAFFYGTVGALLGFTVPYVIANISKDLRTAAVFELIKGTYILSLSPPLSAIIFVATSGSAVNAWLGGLRLHGQVTALEGLGVPPARYLWSPAWLALVTAYIATFVIFTASMILGGWVLYHGAGVKDAFSLLTADFVEPPPTRYPYLVRGLWSVVIYTLAAASIVVAKGSEPKSKSEEVTAAMTSSVMRVTLFVVAMELITVMLVRAWEG